MHSYSIYMYMYIMYNVQLCIAFMIKVEKGWQYCTLVHVHVYGTGDDN